MDAAHLRAFEAVQSNLTARVRLLEEELGTPSFRRHSRAVAPTAAGPRLPPYAARVRQLLEEVRRAVEDDSSDRPRPVRPVLAADRADGGCAASSKVVRFAAESLARCGVRGSLTRPGARPAGFPGFCSGYPE